MIASIARILFATDFSEPARRAQAYAIALAEKFGAELHVLHAVAEDVFLPAPDLAVQWLQQETERAKQRMQSELGPAWSVPGRAVQVIRQGDAVSETIQYANETQSDLIVIATHGRTGLSRLLLGSVAEKIVRLATCPVLTVHPEGHQFVLDNAAGKTATSAAQPQKSPPHSRPDTLSHRKESGPMGDPHDTVCVYNSTNAMQAEMVRNLLEQNGLRATVGDTHNPFPGLTIMPAEVFVERADEKRALEVISRAEHLHREDKTT